MTGTACSVPHKQIDYMQDAIVIVRTGNKVGRFFDDRLGIFHCHSKSCIFDHGQVIVSVSAADHLVCIEPEGVEELPESYPNTEIHLLYKNPDWAYCYWGISPQDLTRLENLKKGELKLRTTVVRNGVNESFDIPVSIEDTEWTVSLPSDGGECYVSLIVDASGEDLELAHSSRIKLAQSYWLEHKEEIKDNDNLFKIYLSLLTTKEGYVAENSLVDEILQFAEGGENE